jgi:hypothetical protein
MKASDLRFITIKKHYELYHQLDELTSAAAEAGEFSIDISVSFEDIQAVDAYCTENELHSICQQGKPQIIPIR